MAEREAELSAVDGLLEGACAGFGRTVIIRGASGIGKTRLLDEVRRRAEAGNLTVLAARASELERDFAFGCVRQLFEPLIRRGRQRGRGVLAGDAHMAEPVFQSPADEGARAPEPGYGILHGLYWLTVNLAEQGPVLLALDDVQWADPDSLRYLSFLSRRLDGVPALVAITTRPAEPGSDPARLRELAQDPATTVIDLAPLSRAAVVEIIRPYVGDDAGERFGAACHEATGGNPFLLGELLREIAPGGMSADRIGALGPERVAEAVEARIERAGDQAPELARAVAVLGDGTELRRAAQLAGIDASEAAPIADALATADILEQERPLRFLHPIVRNAVYGRMLAAERNRWHARAAALLADAGEPAEAIALHVLATEPGERSDAVEVLREAAASARSRGAPDGALRYLERALAEPLPPGSRAAVVSELGRNAATLGDPRALEWLRAAVDMDGASAAGTAAAVALGRTLTFMGRADEALMVGQRMLADPATDGEVGRTMERWLLSLAHTSPTTRRRALPLVRRNLDAALAGDELTASQLASAALECALCDGDAERTTALAERAASGVIDDAGSDNLEPALAIAALVTAERFEPADQLFDRLLADARSRGSLRYYAGTYAFRAWARYRQGRLTDVRADADLYPDLSQPAVTDLVLAGAHVHALVYAGEPDRAAAIAIAVAASPLDRDLSLYQRFAEGLAALRLAQGDHAGALEITSGMAAWEEETGLRNGTWVAWRSQAAVAHAALGERERAVGLAEEQVALARRFGAPGMLGSALRVQGVVRGGEEGMEPLREAVATLAPSALRLEHARAQIELGATLRRAGQQAEARELLRDGLDLAHACGATAVADRALDELVAAGARPRKPATTDADALTPSERRVTEMAADGMTNKEIAQALFVTVKTVETHLGHAYAKLGINSRSQLRGRLARPE